LKKENAISKMEAFILWGGKDGLRLDPSDSFNKFFHSLKYVDYGVTSTGQLKKMKLPENTYYI